MKKNPPPPERDPAEDELLTKFTHRFNLDSAKLKIKERNFDLIYYDCAFEFKKDESQFDEAFAEILLNSSKQKKFFRKYAIVYHNGDDYELKTFNYADYLVNNMSIKYENETPSRPSEDAKIFYKKLQNTVYFQPFVSEEINTFINNLETATYKEEVTPENVYKLFNDWYDWIEFVDGDKSVMSQDIIVQIFLCDILNNTIYNLPKQSTAFETEKESTTSFIYENGKY